MGLKSEDYQEGWEDCTKHFLKTHVPMDELLKTFDKFFDKIHDLKKISKYVLSHYNENKDIQNKNMETDEDRAINMSKILDLIKIEVGKEDKNATKKE